MGLLVRLCRQGRCMFDVESRRYRTASCSSTPPTSQSTSPPDLKRQLAARLIAEDRVRVEPAARRRRRSNGGSRARRPGATTDRLPRLDVSGGVGEIPEVQVVVNDTGNLIFGRCSCPFFDANLMQSGPCEHILALYQASADRRVDRPTSVAAADPAPAERELCTTEPPSSDLDVPARRIGSQPELPRCFAVVEPCAVHAATVPTYATWEPRVQSIASGASAGRNIRARHRTESHLERKFYLGIA